MADNGNQGKLQEFLKNLGTLLEQAGINGPVPTVTCGVPVGNNGSDFELQTINILPASVLIWLFKKLRVHNDFVAIADHFLKTFENTPDAVLYLRTPCGKTVLEAFVFFLQELERAACKTTLKVSYFLQNDLPLTLQTLQDAFIKEQPIELWTWFVQWGNPDAQLSRGSSSSRTKASLAGKLATENVTYQSSIGKKVSVKKLNKHLKGNLEAFELYEKLPKIDLTQPAPEQKQMAPDYCVEDCKKDCV